MLNDLCRNTVLLPALLLLAATLSAAAQQPAQQPPHQQPQQQPPPQHISSMDLGKVQDMLHAAYSDVKKDYYDPTYHGIDIEARYHEYDGKLKTAGSLNDGLRLVAAFLDGFKDSHLFFMPPMRPYTIESGFRIEMVGDQCMIAQVRPGTEAADKLYAGDRVVSINSYRVTREDFWSLEYYFNTLNPPGGYELYVQSPDGAVRHVLVKSIIHERALTIDLTSPTSDYWDLVRREEDQDHASRSVLKVVGDVTYWKMPEFNLDLDDVYSDFSKVKKHGALVLDLRGNGGGAVETLGWMLGSVFDHDVKVADRVGRKDLKPMIAKRLGTAYTGKIIVLVDARSASASELFARTMQLEHRGTVIGDQSSGSVMEARGFGGTSGANVIAAFGFSITDANLMMKDGKSLEKVGVTPDEVALPTQKDLAANLDPVMSRAASLAGGNISAEAAGKMFPVEWLSLK